MKHGTSTAAVFVLLILIVLFGMILLLADGALDTDQPSEDPGEDKGGFVVEGTPDSAVDAQQPEAPEDEPQTPDEPEQLPEETPEDTQEDVPEEEPEEEIEMPPSPITPVEPEPEIPAEPEPVTPQPPQFVSRSLGSGSFRSDTGVSVNLIAYWSAQTTDSSTVQVTVDVYVESYTLNANACPDALLIFAYGNSTAEDMPQLAVETSTLVQTYAGSRTFTVTLADGNTAVVPVTAKWLFGGVYSGVELPEIVCGGDITLVR